VPRVLPARSGLFTFENCALFTLNLVMMMMNRAVYRLTRLGCPKIPDFRAAEHYSHNLVEPLSKVPPTNNLSLSPADNYTQVWGKLTSSLTSISLYCSLHLIQQRGTSVRSVTRSHPTRILVACAYTPHSHINHRGTSLPGVFHLTRGSFTRLIIQPTICHGGFTCMESLT